MRFFAILFLVIIAIVLIAFAFFNSESMEVRFPFVETAIEAPAFLIMFGVYFLGMVSGWTVIAAVRSTLHRASERHDHD